MIGRNDLCWCGSGVKWKKCHFPAIGSHKTTKATALNLEETYKKKYDILIKNDKEIEGIKKACLLAAEMLMAISSMAKEGVTTLELNEFAEKLHKDAGARAAPLGYGTPPFPKSICTSLNEVICHGIPDKTALKQGDILNIDVSPVLHGYFGDCSKMVIIGQTSKQRQLVVDTSYDCLMEAIKILKPGALVSDIGEAIENYAHKKNCSVVDLFVGHGVGLRFHEGPQIHHCKNNTRIPLVSGMTFTIEPMINAGVKEAVVDPKDDWTARTKDGLPSAQFEHTLLITDSGYEILTPWTR